MIEADIPCHLYTKPLLRKPCKQADRVRSLCYNERTQEIAVVSLNGYIHCWNALRMKQVGRTTRILAMAVYLTLLTFHR